MLDALARLRDGGVAVGVSVSGAAAGRRRSAARSTSTRAGAPLFASVQATWNLLERACEDALARGARRRPHGHGEGGARERPARRRAATPAARARSPSSRAPAAPTADAVALAAALAQPWADVVLLGAATVAQLRSNLAAADVALAPEALAALAPLVEPAEAYWRRRAQLAWT